MKIALAQLNYTIGDFSGNLRKILSYIEEAKKNRVDLMIFSELALCGYPPEDLLFLSEFIHEMQKSLEQVCQAAENIALIIGCARSNPENSSRLLNAACLIQDRQIVDFYDKRLIPNYNVFTEARYFDPGKETKVWNIKGKKVAPTICEDIWQHTQWRDYRYSIDPIALIKKEKVDLVVNLSASPYYFQRNQERTFLCKELAQSLGCPFILVNQVGGNDSLIFDGSSLVLNAKGEVVAQADSFVEELLIPEKKEKKQDQEPIEELYTALVMGTRDYVRKAGFQKVIFGLSGGVDSAIVSAIAADALGKENVFAISMPSRYTPIISRNDAREQAALVGIHFQECAIDSLFANFLDFFSPHFQNLQMDHTEENLQARIRGTILMTFANKFRSLVLATGNKSEMAMGYTTLYGDMCGALEVIGDLFKRDVYRIALWLHQKKRMVFSILGKAPSAELAHNQKDTDTLPEYDIVDRVVENYVQEYLDPKEISIKENLDLHLVQNLVHKIHQNEYKRQQSPVSLRVTKRSLTTGRFFPIVQKWDQI